jgi:N-acetylglucosamine kinase-like BadF-type ATPase
VFVGVDGGGTHTRAVVLDSAGTELARRSGPAGIVRPDQPSDAADAVAALCRGVLRDAGADRADGLCCGLAGAGRRQEREAVRVALHLAGVARVIAVVGDAEAALADAFGDAPGVLVIAGTGSIAWARGQLDAAGGDSEAGAVFRTGGWGQILGDEGSGYVIGLDALRRVTRAADGRDPPTSLTAAVLAATKCASAEDLIRFAASASKADIAALAPAVLQCAQEGDAAAAAVRAAAVDALADLAASAASRARLVHPRIGFAGGLIEPGGPLRDDLRAAVYRRMPGCSVLEQRVDAARGAARLAIRHAGAN